MTINLYKLYHQKTYIKKIKEASSQYIAHFKNPVISKISRAYSCSC